MKLKLTIEIPQQGGDPEAELTALLRAAVGDTGLTITTAWGHSVDIMLHDVERVAPASLAQEVTS